MDKLVVAVFSVLFICKVGAALTFCKVSSDCGTAKRCCQRLCLSRTTCEGLCKSEEDCDIEYGESCAQQRCLCVRLPCSQQSTGSPFTRAPCWLDSQCIGNETCKDGVCVDTVIESKGMNTTVLGVVATVGLLLFAGAFYLCLRKQRTSRPSLAGKQTAHNRAAERNTKTSNPKRAKKTTSTDFTQKSKLDGKANGKRHCDYTKGGLSKPPITNACSIVELSAIIEEDEISEIVSK